MINLTDKMKVVLSDTFAFYLKAHYYHWNVEGPHFFEYHNLFKVIYTEVFEAVDSVAEHIRALNAYAPGSFTRYRELSNIQDELTVPASSSMLGRLLSDNDIIINTLTEAFKMAEEENEYGLANFLQDRIDIHKKHGWMLRATIRI